jgi:peroxiredoxin
MKQLFGILLLSTIGIFSASAQVSLGADAQEITLKDVNGKNLSLSSFKGKLVLLDFWASWCAPCRKESKFLVKLYAKYKAKGFEIFSVSIDESPADWKKAIVKDKITWKQVIDTRGWNAPVIRNWGIEGIPTTYLIDKQGKIIALDPGREELEAKIKALTQ